MTEWCNKKSKPRSPPLLNGAYAQVHCHWFPGNAGRALDFVHRSLMRKGSQSLFYSTVCSSRVNWQAGAGSIGPGTGALRRMGSRPRASRGLSRQPTLFAISIQEHIGHRQERPLKPRDEDSKLANAVGCWCTMAQGASRLAGPSRLGLLGKALPGYRRQ